MTDTKNTLTAEQAFSAYMQGKEIWDKDGQFWGESRSAGSSINKFIDAAPFRLAEIPTPKTERLEPEEEEEPDELFLAMSRVILPAEAFKICDLIRAEARKIADKQIDIYAQAHAKARSYDYHGWTKEHGFGDAENGPEAIGKGGRFSDYPNAKTSEEKIK